jgi:CheY-like chemotaxis protein
MSEARSILIADDNGDVRDALTFALREEGYSVRPRAMRTKRAACSRTRTPICC